MWTSSVSAFTALIFVVHFNLVTRMYYITKVHLLVIFVCSIFPYLGYMWLSNYLSADSSQTQNAVLEAHRSPDFYLTVLCSIGVTFLLDYAVTCYMIVINPSPTAFLRQLVAKGASVEESGNMTHFKQLVDIEKQKARKKSSRARDVAH